MATGIRDAGDSREVVRGAAENDGRGGVEDVEPDQIRAVLKADSLLAREENSRVTEWETYPQ